MKSNQIFRSLAMGLILALVLVAIPTTPALAHAIYTSPSSGPVGTSVTLIGGGFEAGEEVTIYFHDKQTFIERVYADSIGAFSTSFIIDEYPAGKHKIWAHGASGVWIYAYFTIEPEINLRKSSGYVDDEISIDGTGFAAEKTATIYFDDAEVGTAETDQNGSFTDASFIVPESYKGSHTVKVIDGEGNYDIAGFSTKHSITITPISGAVGGKVTVNGTGFRSNKSITMTFDGREVITTPPTLESDDKGSFTGIFVVPTSANNTYQVEASDGTNKAAANFTVQATISLSPATSQAFPGHVGMEITISGTGFIPNAAVTLTYATEPIVVATTTADGIGAFSATFTVPPSQAGAHMVTASDGTNTLTSTFYMERAAPPIPMPLLPETDTKAEAEALFDWEDIDDPSGVTYTLQVATTENFTKDSIVLEKEGLSQSEYTVTKEEKLKSTKKDAPYYWRVKAIDGASNEGEWTTPWSFYVGSAFGASNWGLYVLCVLGGLLLLFIVFKLGRRSVVYR